MLKAILRRKNAYDRGTYTIEAKGSWDKKVIWDFEKNAVIKDLKKSGYKVFENDFIYPAGSFKEKEILRAL
jgi:hypothetical protein